MPTRVARYDRAIDRLVRFHPEAVDLAGELAGAADPAPMAHALTAYLHLMSTDAADLATARAARDGPRRPPTPTTVSGPTPRPSRRGSAATGAARRGDLDDLSLRVADRSAGADVRTPARLLHRRRRRSCAIVRCRTLRELDPDHPPRPVRARHGGVRARGVRPLRRGAGRRAGRRGRQPRRRLGDPRRRAHLRDAGPDRRGHRLPALGRARAGRPATCSPCTTGGTSPCTSSRPDGPSGPSPSTTPRSTTPARSACRSRCSTPARCCGGCCSTAPTPAIASPPRRRVGTEARRRRRGTSFNDLHAVMALAGAGRLADAARAGRASRRRGCRRRSGSNAAMTGRDRPARRAAPSWPSSRIATTTSSPSCCPIRRVLARFGGSHAQRDALQRTLLESALRGGRYRLAPALTAERLGVRETSVYGWTQRARALRGLADEHGAAAADATAAAHRERFRVA